MKGFDMGDKGKKDKGKRLEQKKSKQTIKEKRKQKKTNPTPLSFSSTLITKETGRQMTSVIKYYEGINSVAVIGNYLPRQCGIATFTTDLVEGLSTEAPDIHCYAVAMNDTPEGYPLSG